MTKEELATLYPYLFGGKETGIKRMLEMVCGCQAIIYKDGFELWYACGPHGEDPSGIPALGAWEERP